jgi:hypothetical protein
MITQEEEMKGKPMQTDKHVDKKHQNIYYFYFSVGLHMLFRVASMHGCSGAACKENLHIIL